MRRGRELGDRGLRRSRRRSCTSSTRSTSSDDELRLRRAPGRGPGRARVGLGQRGEQVQRLDRRDALGDPLRSWPGRRGRAASRPPTSSRWLRDELGEHVDVGGGKAHARAEPARDLDADVGVVAGAALAEVVEQRAQSPAGRAGRRGRRSAAALAVASSRCRSTVKRWYALRCGRDRTGSHSGRIRVQTPRWSSASITGIASRAGEQQPDEELARAGRPRIGQRRRVARRAARASRGRSRVACSAASRAARSASSGSSAGSASAVEVHLAVAQHARRRRATRSRFADAAERSAQRRPRPGATRRRSSTRSRARPRDAGHERVAVGEPERLGDARPAPGARARCSAGRCAGAARRARRAACRTRSARLARRARAGSHARGLRPVQRVHVAQAAAAFLQIGLEHERDFAGLRVTRRRRASRERFEPALRRAAPTATRARPSSPS